MNVQVAPQMPRSRDVIDMTALSQAIELVGSCRGFGLKCGMLAVLFATSNDDDARATFAEEFGRERQNFLDAIDRKASVAPFLADLAEISGQRKQVYAFHETLRAIEPDPLNIQLEQAISLADASRHVVLPAIYDIIATLDGMAKAQAEEAHRRTAEKAALVDEMLAQTGRIGRMIGLISINASVEAARAGGDSGRAFQVIAEEVRDLARQSSTILDQTKARLAEDAAARS